VSVRFEYFYISAVRPPIGAGFSGAESRWHVSLHFYK